MNRRPAIESPFDFSDSLAAKAAGPMPRKQPRRVKPADARVMQYQCKTSPAAPSFLARQAGLMCENASECKEMQEFSRVLQQLFDKRHQWNILKRFRETSRCFISRSASRFNIYLRRACPNGSKCPEMSRTNNCGETISLSRAARPVRRVRRYRVRKSRLKTIRPVIWVCQINGASPLFPCPPLFRVRCVRNEVRQ